MRGWYGLQLNREVQAVCTCVDMHVNERFNEGRQCILTHHSVYNYTHTGSYQQCVMYMQHNHKFVCNSSTPSTYSVST